MPRNDDHDDEVELLRWERFLVQLGDAEIAAPEVSAAAAWRDELRRPTWGMWRRLLAGEPLPPAWTLVRAVSFARDLIDDEMVMRWLDAGHLAAVSTAQLMSRALTLETVQRLCECLTGLRSIEIRHIVPVAREMRALARASRVEEWTFVGAAGTGLRTWLDAEITRNMHSLTIVSPQLDECPWWASSRLAGLREIELIQSRESAKEIAQLVDRLPTTLNALALSGHAGASLAPVLECSFSRLARLDLSHNGLTDSMLRAAPVLASESLAHLDLSYNKIGRSALKAIAKRFDQLERLELSGTQIDRIDVTALPATACLQTLGLARTPCASRDLGLVLAHCNAGLRALRLEGSKVDLALVEQLGAAISLPRLVMLDLGYCELDGDAFVHLVTQADLPCLETLRLSGCPLGVCIVTERPRLGALRELWIDDTRINLPEPLELFVPEALPALELLRAGGNELRPVTAEVMARFVAQRPIRDLGIERSVYWDDEKIALLLEACSADLVRAQIGGNACGERSVGVLATARLQRLAHLDVRGSALHPDDVAAILANPALTGLASLWLDGDLEHINAIARAPLLSRLEDLSVGQAGPAGSEQALRGSEHCRPWTQIFLG